MVNPSPDKRHAIRHALDLLSTFRKDTLPIYMFDMTKAFPDLRVKPYSWFMNVHGLTFSELITITDSDSGCCWYDKPSGRYLILYNDQITSYGRRRFTIAHELGHYAMGHANVMGGPYQCHEVEADIFAQTLLAPACVLREIGLNDPKDISEVCGVSLACARVISETLCMSTALSMRDETAERNVLQNFEGYIRAVRNRYRCVACGRAFELVAHSGVGQDNGHECVQSAGFCIYCGKKGLRRMFMPTEPPIWQKADPCQRCGAKQYGSGDYCMICGLYLNNTCENPLCKRTLPVDALYCITCGQRSHFSRYDRRIGDKPVQYAQLRLHLCPMCSCYLSKAGHLCRDCGFVAQNACITCSKPADDHARFCTHCGSETLYGRERYIVPWQDELLEKFRYERKAMHEATL